MAEFLEEAMQHEDAGRLREAAKFYALEAFATYIQANYRNGRGFRIASALMLESICADVRGGNEDRAKTHLGLIKEFLSEIADDSEQMPPSGLGWEWLGDAHLLVGDSSAVEYYRRAQEIFEDLDLDDMLFWGAESEYDYAFGAMKSYFEWKGVEYPENHSLNFVNRVEAKIEVAKGLIGE